MAVKSSARQRTTVAQQLQIDTFRDACAKLSEVIRVKVVRQRKAENEKVQLQTTRQKRKGVDVSDVSDTLGKQTGL